MELFKIKKSEPEPYSDPGNFQSADYSPQPAGLGDQITVFREQGYSDEQIMQYLQSQGYPPQEVYGAMTPGMQQMPQQRAPPSPVPPSQPASTHQQDSSHERIEEVAESIVNEKWNELMKEVSSINEWKEKIEAQVSKIEHEIGTIKENFDSLHKGMLGKITEYDQHMTKVGGSLQAMEMAFQKLLPTFTENVNRLSGIVENAPKRMITKPAAPVKKIITNENKKGIF